MNQSLRHTFVWPAAPTRFRDLHWNLAPRAEHWVLPLQAIAQIPPFESMQSAPDGQSASLAHCTVHIGKSLLVEHMPAQSEFDWHGAPTPPVPPPPLEVPEALELKSPGSVWFDPHARTTSARPR
jgi:hypothetical protein